MRKKRQSGKSWPAPDLPMAPGLESSFRAKMQKIRMAEAMNSLKKAEAVVMNAWG